MTMTWQDVEKLKSEGRYRAAGQLAYVLGYDHGYGIRQNMNGHSLAVSEFKQGWAEMNVVYQDMAVVEEHRMLKARGITKS